MRKTLSDNNTRKWRNFMARQVAVGRLDRIIRELEQLYKEAQDIFDAHVEVVRCGTPGIPFGVLKSCEIAAPAGSALNYIAALKIVRKKITGEKELAHR
jgi:hypothetical protein